MSDLAKYTKFSMFLDGALLVEAQSVDVTHAPGTQNVITIEKGLAGFSPGAGMCTIKVENAMPRAAVEFDYLDAAYNATVLEVVVYRSGKKLLTKGVITDVTEGGGAEKAAQLSFTMTCAIPKETT